MDDGLFPLAEEAASHAQKASDAQVSSPTGSTDQPFTTTAGFELAAENPVVSVYVCGVLPHLDREFEYAVPAACSEVGPGMRVRVRFAGKDREAFVRSRYAIPKTTRPLAPLTKVVSVDTVVSDAVFAVCEEIAQRYAGSVSDVVRLAVPPRHAGAESAFHTKLAQLHLEEPAHMATGEHPVQRASEEAAARRSDSVMAKYAGFSHFFARINSAESVVPRAHVVLDPVDDWTAFAIESLRQLPEDAGALLLASDQREVDRLAAALSDAGFDFVAFGSSQGPHARYSAFLSALFGLKRIVIGTRSAVFAPVKNLRCILIWDCDDDLFEEPRSPYPHTRSVALARSFREHVGIMFVSPTVSEFAWPLVQRHTLAQLVPAAQPHANTHPRVELMDEYLKDREGPSGRSRIPGHAYALIRKALSYGPVLVQVPRAGYVPALACTLCATKAQCTQCHATLSSPERGGTLVCSVCARRFGHYRCSECNGTQFRPLVIGAGRTADDLSRSFPAARVLTSGGAAGVVADAEVSHGDIVVATPGAEPHPKEKFAAAVIVDAGATLGRAAYNADTEAVRRFSQAIREVRTFGEGGQVLVVGPAEHPALRSLVLPRSTAYMDRVLEERAVLSLPPHHKVIEVQGSRSACERWVRDAHFEPYVGVFGPVELSSPGLEAAELVRVIVRCPIEHAASMIARARASYLIHHAKKLGGSLRIQVEPPHVF